MPKRKSAKQAEIKPWLSGRRDCIEGRFIQVGNSLLLNKKFQSLKPSAQMLYFAMCMESGGYRDVVFPHGAARKYGLPDSTFDRQVKALIKAGFLERVPDPNGYQFTKAVYRLCCAWKTDLEK